MLGVRESKHINRLSCLIETEFCLFEILLFLLYGDINGSLLTFSSEHDSAVYFHPKVVQE